MGPPPVSVPVVLAVVATADPDPDDLREFLRLVVALLATGAEVRLLADGADAWADGGAPEAVQDLLDGLASFDVVAVPLEQRALAAGLGAADHVLRLGAGRREARPSVLAIGGAGAAIDLFRRAGQVLKSG